nr:competence/damage-inducible protein A [Deinobacterium chartae]
MIAEIISVGTELLLGEILDTNAPYLATELKQRGVRLYNKSTVGDNLERLCAALEGALSRADLVILGGGLGPTDDDLTREAIAAVLGETPEVDSELLAHLEGLFSSRGRVMPLTNRKQAWLIPSAESLPNPIGTAPGWFVRTQGKVIVALPGPPHEMQRMWTEQVLPRLQLPESALFHVTYHTLGIGESNIAELLGAELTQSANPSVATYARAHGVDVRVAASAATLEQARALAQPVQAQLERVLGAFVYGTDRDTLASVIESLLSARGQTVATVESITGGLVADRLTDAPGASTHFAGGAVAYTNAVKLGYGLTPATLSAAGAVSEAAALELARGARQAFGSDWGLSTTGVAGPAPLEGHAPGVAFIGVVGPEFERAVRLDWPGDRRQVKERAALSAMGALLRALKEG